MDVSKENLQRFLASFEALSELGPALTAEEGFAEAAPRVLRSLMDAVAISEGALFRFTDRPALLASVTAHGFASFPEQAIIPLLPRHTHALTRLSAPVMVADHGEYFTSNGNFAPQLIRCVVPLKVQGRLAGILGLGQRRGGASYTAGDLGTLSMLGHYIALGLHTYSLTETLAQRVGENLKLVATVHSFYDNTLEAFAAAIDFKNIHIHGHSLRVGRYAAGIAEAMGMDQHDVAGVRAAGYLHDIGKVAVDKALFNKPGALEPEEFRQMADHTTLGHEIVRGIQFPWPRIPDVVRWHHERVDGTGYPDRLRLTDMHDAVRIMALADSFDAMTSERPYRKPIPVASALRELVGLAPQKFDPDTVQALLIQVRRDAVAAFALPSREGSVQPRFIEERLGAIAPADVDLLAGSLQHRMTGHRVHLA